MSMDDTHTHIHRHHIHTPHKHKQSINTLKLQQPQMKDLIHSEENGLLFGVNEKLLTQHISGPITKYRLLYVSNQGRAGARAWTRVRARAKG